MPQGTAATIRAIVTVLAELAPQHHQPDSALSIPLDWFRWLPADAIRLFYDPVAAGLSEAATAALGGGGPGSDQYVSIDRDFGERLAALDQVRATHRSVRAGWLFVGGQFRDTAGRRHHVFQPLVTVPVRVERVLGFGRTRLVPAGDTELSPFIRDRDMRGQLEERLEFGGGSLEGLRHAAIPNALLTRLRHLQAFALDAAAAAGWDARAVLSAGPSGEEVRSGNTLVVIAGVGIYVETDDSGTAGLQLQSPWLADADLSDDNALSALYIPRQTEPTDADNGPIDSAYPLTPTQTEAVRRSRVEAVTVVSGAAGTGKSHTIAAIACDAVARGQSVLVAAKSDATIDALISLFERAPGVQPLVFGSDERRSRLAARLAAGQPSPISMASLDEAAAQITAAQLARGELLAALRRDLEAEQAWEHGLARGVDTDIDVGVITALVSDADGDAGGWLAGRRSRKARKTLRRLLGSDDVAVARSLVRTAAAADAASALIGQGGLECGDRWPRLASAVRNVRRAVAARLELDVHSEDRLNASSLAAIATLATALRSGRAARRLQLSRLGDDRLTRALPLWLGTLADIDDLLPPVEGLFDLVILDEASSIEQPMAAPALLRGRRGLIVGDPQQLRHVSFLSDDLMEAALRRHNLHEDADVAARLDVRRNSIFDIATGVAPVMRLDEEFRSVPHLVHFLARRVYGGALLTATTTPANETRDAIDIVRVSGTRQDGVIEAEVRAVVRELRNLRHAGHRSVGVVTPFRSQADAIEDAALAAFSADDVEALDLRIGTVHSFQGNEREIVLGSIGLDEAAPRSTWTFIDDSQFFAVFVSRARRRFVLFLAADPPPGLLADYLAQADRPPNPPEPVGEPGAWAATLADHLIAIGVPTRLNYPVGRHVLDLCIGDRYRFAAVETCVHPDGPAAHIDRRLALMELGWDILEAYPSRWSDRAAEVAIELAGTIGWPHRPT